MPASLDKTRLSLPVSAIAAVVAGFIYFLIWVFGRRLKDGQAPWLDGPTTPNTVVGDAPYEQVAAKEHLTVQRDAQTGGLLQDFDELTGPTFQASQAPPQVRDFYEQTAQYSMDVWTQHHFPASIGTWLLVKTLGRKHDQLNFPTNALEAAHGIGSEIVHLLQADGVVRYTGWYRTIGKRTLYTGFYTSVLSPTEEQTCVKVNFPMPHGNATVLLRPSMEGDHFCLTSAGRKFGDPGFYRVHTSRSGKTRVWHIRTLKEYFRLYVTGDVLWCDHTVKFLGMRVLTLRYKLHKSVASSQLAQAS